MLLGRRGARTAVARAFGCWRVEAPARWTAVCDAEGRQGNVANWSHLVRGTLFLGAASEAMHGLALAQVPNADAVITDRLDRGHEYDLSRAVWEPLKQACATPFVGLPVFLTL